ncbi:hypothetical protein GCM10025878_13920 [Leuconostoc gasicomitatum]|uniref:phage tail protein n=1 Tax=Leuconostoc gasicomitatum TaxID=115778 RepID=UPI0001DB57F2|nr:phage tail protein [Leuconostoc gasicomitatum]GMA06321.1 hypothetical protein GCM10025878_13920 [Leuconostoc gasicomitatum]CBL92225.1 phage endopeptidase, putative [Leuconostoc gasicomitatum LMG 18811]
MIKFKNVAGQSFLAVGTIQRKSALNGEKSLTGTIYDGDDVLNKIDKGWSLEFDDEPYVITYFERNDNDNTVSFDAIHRFFWNTAKSVLYTSTSGSHTIKWYLDQIFSNTGYTYALNYAPTAIGKDNWGMKTKLSLFNDIISSIGGEFEINGTLVSIFEKVGTDLSTIVRYGFNLSDMSVENDAVGFVTYGEGFGAYADQQNQRGDRLHVTYTSPLASVYGKLQAEPVDDQRFTIQSNLLNAVKDEVDGSFSVSIKLSLYDLTAAGYPYKMANVGDWLMAIDERLDFKQRIRIISIDDEFSAEGTRISYTVTAGNVGIVQKYQDSNASLATQVNNAMDAANQAVTDANVALIAANGKNTSYYVDSFDILPKTANEGDLGWVQTGDGRVLYIYIKKPDGSLYWEKRIDPEMGEQIAAGVEEAVLTAKSNSDKAIDDNNVLINQTINTVSKQQANNEIDKRNFDANAQSMVNQGVVDAKVNTQTVAQQTLATANANLDQAQAQIEAAYKSADGIVNKKIDDTATSIGTTIIQNKTDANNGISVAQSTAQQALDGLKATVSKSDYDAKTKDLTSKVGTAQLTADQATTTIGNYQKSNDGRVSTAETNIKSNKDAIALTATKQDLNSATNTLNTSIGAVNVKADSVTTTVAQLSKDTTTKFATQQTTIDGITQTVSANTGAINSVTSRVTTAEGTLTSTTNRVSGVETKQTTLAGQVSQEISDRNNGDSNTLNSAATYTQLQVSSATSGLNSTITQTASAIIANLGASNLFPNSEFTADYGYLSKSGTIEIRQNQNIDNKISGVITIVSTAAGYQGYWANNIPVIGGQKYSGATRVHYTNGGLTNGRALLDVWYVDSSGARINGGTGGSWKVQTPQIDSPYWIDLYFDGITAPINASYMQASLIVNNAGAGQKATFTQTTITATDVHQTYTPNDDMSANLTLFKDNWSIGIKDNIQGIVSGIVGTPTQMSLISKNITLDGNTTVTGDFYALGGNFKNLNASNMTVGTLNGNQVNVTNINANNIVAGTISGANLSINLNTGQVYFQNGRIYSQSIDDQDGIGVDINIDKRYIATRSSLGYSTLKDGGLYLSQYSLTDSGNSPYFGVKNDTSGFGTGGALIYGTKSVGIATLPHSVPNYIGTENYNGIIVSEDKKLFLAGYSKGVMITGGADIGNSAGSPFINLGTTSSNTVNGTGGDRISLYAKYLYLSLQWATTTSSSANMFIASDGAVVRSSSSSKYKLDIEYEKEPDTANKLLTLDPATWHDKFESEQIAKFHKTGVDTERSIDMNKRRYYGVIAEDLVKAGLDYLVQRSPETGDVEGVEYSKIGVALIPIVRELRNRIIEQNIALERLKEQLK